MPAALALETAWGYGQIHPEVWHLQDIREIAAVSLSRCQEISGRVEDALRTMDEALSESPASPRLQRRREELRAAHNPLRNAS